MKFYTWILLFVLLSSNICPAQVIGKSDLEKMVDYLNCRIAKESLDNEGKKDKINAFLKKCNCDLFPGFDTIKIAIPSNYKTNQKLAKEINLIKNQYTPETEINEYKKLFTETIFSDKENYPRVNTFAKNKATFINDLKLDINIKLDSLIKEAKKSVVGNSGTTGSTGSSRASKGQKKAGEDDDSIFSFKIDVFSILFSTLLFLIIFSLYNIYMNGNFRKKSQDKPDKYGRDEVSHSNVRSEVSDTALIQSLIEEIRQLKNELNSHREETKSLIGGCQDDINALYNKNEKMSSLLGLSKTGSNVAPVYPKSVESQNHFNNPTSLSTFYLSSPNPDGSFNTSSVTTSYKEGATVFTFYEIEHKLAKFEINTQSKAIRMAIQYPESIIDPVCEAQNAYDSKSTMITTVVPGEAKLEGEKWRMTQKAKIRYDS